MPYIPKQANQLFELSLPLEKQGKVRNSYKLSDPKFLLVVATDRASIFDFVLNLLVEQKGYVLNAMNIFWRINVLKELFDHDLVAYGKEIDEYLLAKDRNNVDLMKRAVVVRRMEVLDCECIVRGYLTGSGLKDYNREGMVGGHKLPPGLVDGSKLPYPIFTPSTKAKKGHDVNITADEVADRYGVRPERSALQMYMLASGYALERGIIIADTKLEFGDGNRLCDEVFTPDSSRFWDVEEYKSREADIAPQPHDKQIVRNWGKKQGIHKLDPELLADCERVEMLSVPKLVRMKTTEAYRSISARLMDSMPLEEFQHDVMMIP